MTNPLTLNYIDIFIIILIYFLAGFLSFPVSVLSGLFGYDNSYVIPVSQLLTYSIFFYIYYTFFMKGKNIVYNFKFNITKAQLYHIPIILLFYFGGFLLSDVLVGLIPTEGGLLGKLYSKMMNLLLDQFPNKYINFLVVVIMAPFFEELLFRGFILKGLLNNSNISPQIAIILSAIVFGGIHVFPWQVLGGFIAGILLGIIFYKTQSLFFPILIHFLNNFTAFMLYMYFDDDNLLNIFSVNNITLFIIGLALLSIFGFIYFKLTRNISWKSY